MAIFIEKSYSISVSTRGGFRLGLRLGTLLDGLNGLDGCSKMMATEDRDVSDWDQGDNMHVVWFVLALFLPSCFSRAPRPTLPSVVEL